MVNWARCALARIGADKAAALVTVLATEGSVPREAGTKMVIWGDGQAGTIGGGNLEHRATDQARRMLAAREAFAVQDYPLGPLLAQCCGGRVRLLIERLDARSADWLTDAARRMDAAQPFELRTRFDPDALGKSVMALPASADEAAPITLAGTAITARGARPGPGDELVERAKAPRPPVILFGAGHVGQAVARALEPLPFRLTWFDTRPETAVIPGVRVRAPAELAAEAARAGSEASVLILTHDHGLDYDLVRAALAGEAQAYLGVIGSKTKKARFVSRLRAEGLGEDEVARMTCPIGLPMLRSKAPEVIAVSVVADLLLRAQAARAEHPMKDRQLASL